VDSVRRHFISLLDDSQLSALQDGYAEVIAHLRQIRDRD
jgi:hypothetical protein